MRGRILPNRVEGDAGLAVEFETVVLAAGLVGEGGEGGIEAGRKW